MAHPDEFHDPRRTAALDRLAGAVEAASAQVDTEVLEALADTVEATVWLGRVPRTLSLAEVLAGAERAEQRVAAWPVWKRRVA
jgi:hypothetical protein